MEGRVMNSLTILDMKGVKMGKMKASYDFVKIASGVAQDNYPEILGK